MTGNLRPISRAFLRDTRRNLVTITKRGWLRKNIAGSRKSWQKGGMNCSGNKKRGAALILRDNSLRPFNSFIDVFFQLDDRNNLWRTKHSLKGGKNSEACYPFEPITLFRSGEGSTKCLSRPSSSDFKPKANPINWVK